MKYIVVVEFLFDLRYSIYYFFAFLVSTDQLVASAINSRNRCRGCDTIRD
jgi:hypothetical protein